MNTELTIKIILSFLSAITLLFSNSRVSFSRPGPMMQIPSMAFEKNSPNIFMGFGYENSES